MIKSAELRKGNIVKNDLLDIFKKGFIELEARNIYELAVFESGQISENYASFFEPIKLNEEWLLNFGFKSKMIVEERIIKNEYFLDCCIVQSIEPLDDLKFDTVSGKAFAFFNKDKAFITGHLEYVHQLQNIYHAIFASELERVEE